MKFEKILTGILVLILLLIFIDVFLFNVTEYGYATIKELEYSPSANSVGSGIVTNTSGSPSMIIVNSHKNNEWIAVIETEKGIEVLDVDSTIFYTLSVGSRVKYKRSIGRFSGIQYSLQIIQE